jgi:hypothetical protein
MHLVCADYKRNRCIVEEWKYFEIQGVEEAGLRSVYHSTSIAIAKL